jgi:hypothetical protein
MAGRYGFRLAVMLFAVPATYFFMFWLPGSLLLAVLPGAAWLQSALASVTTILVAWWLWTRLGEADPGLGASALRGGAIVGGIGFCAGFFGPMIFAPGANQGPMLGIFITGPLGFLIGAIGGVARFMLDRQAARRSAPD